MIEIDRTRLTEPAEFDAKCRQAGLSGCWNIPRRVESRVSVREITGVRSSCNWPMPSVVCVPTVPMHEPVGTVDHFLPVDADESLAYEWATYRFAAGWINSSKTKRWIFLTRCLCVWGGLRCCCLPATGDGAGAGARAVARVSRADPDPLASAR